MDDYEQQNALEWDMNIGGGKARQAPEDSWQVVSGSKKKQQQQQKLPPRPPFAAPPSVQKMQQQKPSGQAQRSQSFQQWKQGKLAQQAQTAPQKPIRPSENTTPQPSQQKRQPQSESQSPLRQLQERKAPSKWLSEAPRQRDAGRRRRPPRMIQGSDHAGEKQWRAHQEPQSSIRVPIELVHPDRGHEVIAKQYGTFIFDQNKESGRGSRTFGIWGEPEAVAAVLKSINAWINDYQQASRKSSRSGQFAKIQSLTPALRIKAEKDWERDVRKHRYRQFPPPMKAFEAIGSFYWPVKDYKPEEILGSSYEALDPIRMDGKCYVVFDKDQGLFQVMGRADNVKTGLLRLRNTCFQIAARQTVPMEQYLLHDTMREGSSKENVILKETNRPETISGEGNGEVNIGYCPRSNTGEYQQTSSSSEEAVKKSILVILRKLHYYRGSLQLRIRFGTFLATQYMRTANGIYTMEQYQAMVREKAFHGKVTQELGDVAVETLALNTLQSSTEMLHPQDPMASHLANVRPLYTAVFTFVDQTDSEAGDIRLSITWQEAQDFDSTFPTFEVISKKWTRLERDSQTASSILDISLSNLATGMAWQFEMSAAQIIEDSKLPAGLFEFGERLRVDPKAARKAAESSTTDMSFIQMHRPPPMPLKHLEQRLTYRYAIKESDYTVELTRFQHRNFPPRKSPVSPAPEPIVYEPRWGFSAYRIEWDTMFTRNERLPIGEKADWSHDEDAWFPSDHPEDEKEGGGFAQMMAKLKKVANLVMDAKDEDLMGGMQVG